MTESFQFREAELLRRLGYMVEANMELAVACSSGKDSMALCEYFLKLSKKLEGFCFTVLHINYQLRGNSSDLDEKFIQNWCDENKIKLLVKKVEGFKQTSDIQNWARSIRYDWFRLWSEEHNGVVAIAHHRADLAETALFKLARGSELDRLSGMKVYNEKTRIWRPFLKFSLEELNKLNNGKKIPHREDESNATIKYSRNRIRHNVLPELEQTSQGATNKIYRAAIEITQLYDYVLDVHRQIFVQNELSFSDIALMPEGLARVVIRKFIRSKFELVKTSESLGRALYHALLSNDDVEFNLNHEYSAICRNSTLRVVTSSSPYRQRRKQHEKYFMIEKLENYISDDADLEVEQ